jgi:hypothetical protein
MVSQVTLNTSFILFHQAVVAKADPTLKLIFICKFLLIVGVFLTLELRE